MNQLTALTFDVDWAPESCIAACVAMCREAGVPATFFVTHPSPVLESLRGDPRFELGVHPNFLPGSSHGATPREVLDHVLALAPAARTMRTHGLYQSSSLFDLVADHYPGLQGDASLYLPGHPGLMPVDLFMGHSGRRITRLPTLWEDDAMMVRPDWSWSWTFQRRGLCVYDFHPIHVALNAASLDPYRQLREATAGRPLATLRPEDWQPHVGEGRGAGWFLRELLRHTPRESFHTLAALVDQHRAGGLPGIA